MPRTAIALAMMILGTFSTSGSSKADNIDLTGIDPQRLKGESEADADVLASLRKNGDVASVVRPVDVRFVGSVEAVRRLAEDAASLGWTVMQVVPQPDGSQALDVDREQSTEPDAILALTVDALRIEQRYGVRYDGWGCVAAKSP